MCYIAIQLIAQVFTHIYIFVCVCVCLCTRDFMYLCVWYMYDVYIHKNILNTHHVFKKSRHVIHIQVVLLYPSCWLSFLLNNCRYQQNRCFYIHKNGENLYYMKPFQHSEFIGLHHFTNGWTVKLNWVTKKSSKNT